MATAKPVVHNKSLLVHPGQPEQRALNVVPSNHDLRMQVRLEQAQAKFPGATFAWLDHFTGEISPV